MLSSFTSHRLSRRLPAPAANSPLINPMASSPELAEVIRFEAGDIDVISRVGAQSHAPLERDQHAAACELQDAGAGLECHFLFFNWNDLDPQKLPEVRRKQAWFRHREFREAVPAAIDRQAIALLVFQGRATPLWGQVTPGNKMWVSGNVPHPPRSLDRATALLRSVGFTRLASC